MDTLQLEKILNDHLKTAFYGVCAKDELPDSSLRPLAIIVNEDIAQLPGSHWCALYLFQNGRGEYFDSYGRSPDIYIAKYLRKQAPKGWEYNARPVQSVWSTLCGGFCLQYLEARHKHQRKPLSRILHQLFPYKIPYRNDLLVQHRLANHYNIELPIYDQQKFPVFGL